MLNKLKNKSNVWFLSFSVTIKLGRIQIEKFMDLYGFEKKIQLLIHVSPSDSETMSEGSKRYI